MLVSQTKISNVNGTLMLAAFFRTELKHAKLTKCPCTHVAKRTRIAINAWKMVVSCIQLVVIVVVP